MVLTGIMEFLSIILLVCRLRKIHTRQPLNNRWAVRGKGIKHDNSVGRIKSDMIDFPSVFPFHRFVVIDTRECIINYDRFF